MLAGVLSPAGRRSSHAPRRSGLCSFGQARPHSRLVRALTRSSSCCSPMAAAKPRRRERQPLSCFGRPHHSPRRYAPQQPPLTSGRHQCGLHRPRSRNRALLTNSPSLARSYLRAGRRQTAVDPRGLGAGRPSAWGRAVPLHAQPHRLAEVTRWRHTCARSAIRRVPCTPMLHWPLYSRLPVDAVLWVACPDCCDTSH